MASLINNHQYYQIQFTGQDKKTRTISLSAKKYSWDMARELFRIVEKLIYNRENGIDILDKKTRVWIGSASPALQEKLEKVDLIQVAKPPEIHTAVELWEKVFYIKEEVEKFAESTVNNYRVASMRFFSYFDEKTDLTEFTKEKMELWRLALLEHYAVPTVTCTIKRAKTAFNWAVKLDWLPVSPLAGVKAGTFINRDKDYRVTVEAYRKLLAACPNTEWQAIIALARIGGLRAPSEVVRLRWADIKWGEDKFLVTSQKTARYGKGNREVPLFAELRRVLEAWHAESEGEEFVIPTYRDLKTNLGTMFARIAQKAGLGKIPRPFDNMRATRCSEISRKYGPACESRWMGHTIETCVKHYDQAFDEDFSEASREILD